MIALFRRLFSKAPPPMVPAKDPMDWRHTPTNSSAWYTDTYCPQCKAWTAHRDRMAKICHACGAHGDMRQYRSSRRIWDGTQWLVQHKYGNGPADYTLQLEAR